MSHVPGALPLGFEFEVNRYWCGPGRNADRPGIADVVVARFEAQVVVEDLQPVIGAVRDVYVALRIHRNPVRQVELVLARCPAFSLPTCVRNRPFLSYFTTRLLT